MTWYHWIFSRWLSQWCHQESSARGRARTRPASDTGCQKKLAVAVSPQCNFSLLRHGYTWRAVCAFVGRRHGTGICHTREKGVSFWFQTVCICWFGQLSGCILCLLNASWDKLPARIVQTTGIYKLWCSTCYLCLLATFINLSGSTPVDSGQLCAGCGGWLLIDEWKQLWAFPSQPIRVWQRPLVKA